MPFPKSQYDIVLVQPPAESIREYLDAPDFPHIGIAYLGGYLERHLTLTPALLDARLARLSLEETVDQIVDLQPKIVGVTAMTHMVVAAAALAERVKKRLPEVYLILGGVHATFLPEQTLREFPVFDFIVMGEGETAFSALVGALLNCRDYKSIRGLCFQDDGKTVNNGRGEPIDNLDELGQPAWHLFEPEAMRKYCLKMPIITSRGCPFNCNFCSRPYGKKFRMRRADLIIEEMTYVASKFNLQHFWFFDENLSVDKKNIENLCWGLLEKRLNLTWETSLHVNTFDRPLAHLLKQAGCYRVGFGVESGNDQIISSMGKGITKARVLTVHRWLKEEGLTTTAFFILGHPGETRRTIYDTIKFAVKLNADQTSIGIMVPYPGTRVWDLALSGQGGYKKLSPNWSDYNKMIGNAVELEGINRRELEILQMVGYGLIYLLNLRLLDFWRMFHQNSKLILNILKKILFPIKTKQARTTIQS